MSESVVGVVYVGLDGFDEELGRWLIGGLCAAIHGRGRCLIFTLIFYIHAHNCGHGHGHVFEVPPEHI